MRGLGAAVHLAPWRKYSLISRLYPANSKYRDRSDIVASMISSPMTTSTSRGFAWQLPLGELQNGDEYGAEKSIGSGRRTVTPSAWRILTNSFNSSCAAASAFDRRGM